jgi:TRAP-type C4-dicarboxylate transport system substrate-binding protein
MKFFADRLASLGLAVALVAFGASQARAQSGEVYTLKFHNSYPPSLAFYKSGTKFRELVEEWSDGRIKFENYEAGALTSVAGMIDAVDQGIIDIGQSWGGFYVGDVPEADVEVGLPLAWSEPWEAYDAYYNRGLKELAAEAYESRFNVKHFPVPISMTYVVSTRQDLSSLEDLKRLKIRALGVYGELMQSLGASAVVVPGPELYTALQLGTIDGLVYGIEAAVAQGLQEYLKTAIVTPNFNAGVGHFLINRDTWNSLPPDLQNVIERAAHYGTVASAMDYAAVEAASVGELQRAGVKLLTLSEAEQKKLVESATTLWDKIAERSEIAAKGVEIIREQQKDYGDLD